MKKPEWAKAKVKLHLATCWMGVEDDGTPILEGVNWFNDYILLWFSVFFHNFFVQPFCETAAFPIKILEKYEDIESIMQEQIPFL